MFDDDILWFVSDAPYEIHFFINLLLHSDFLKTNCNSFRYYYIIKIIFFKLCILNRYIKRVQISLNTPLFKTTLQKARLKAVLVSMTFTCLKKKKKLLFWNVPYKTINHNFINFPRGFQNQRKKFSEDQLLWKFILRGSTPLCVFCSQYYCI